MSSVGRKADACRDAVRGDRRRARGRSRGPTMSALDACGARIIGPPPTRQGNGARLRWRAICSSLHVAPRGADFHVQPH